MTHQCTILIPTKDRADLLRRALNSAIKSAPEGAEILVIDDKSDPPAQCVLGAFSDPRIKLVVNEGPNGAAAARNFGISVAKGDIIFFLDDDDELLPGYCDTILTSVLPAHRDLAYGFSACLIAAKDPDDKASDTMTNNRLPNGVIAQTTPFPRKLCGFGMGFWIRREVFEKFGAIDEDLATNEDTEYVCRLIDAKQAAWFNAAPGMRLHTHAIDTTGNTLDHVTLRTKSADRARCFLEIFNRHQRLVTSDKQARHHFARRYIKLSTKSGALGESWHFAARLPNLSERISARYYAVVNFAAYRLTGKHPKT